MLHRAQIGALTEAHRVDAPVIGIAVAGDCSTTIQGWRADASRGLAWVEPGATQRQNRAGRFGAAVLAILPDTDEMGVFDAPRVINEPAIAFDATRAFAELLNAGDTLSPIVLQSHVLALVAQAAGKKVSQTSDQPTWLARARDYIQSHFRSPLALEAVADAAGVSVPHLARGFRARHGVTVGDYARRLRILWAAEQLMIGHSTVAAVSLAAGFFDQSHFSREFHRQLGMSPGRFRHALGAKR